MELKHNLHVLRELLMDEFATNEDLPAIPSETIAGVVQRVAMDYSEHMNSHVYQRAQEDLVELIADIGSEQFELYQEMNGLNWHHMYGVKTVQSGIGAKPFLTYIKSLDKLSELIPASLDE